MKVVTFFHLFYINMETIASDRRCFQQVHASGSLLITLNSCNHSIASVIIHFSFLTSCFFHVAQDPCDNIFCHNGGSCFAPADDPMCICHPGFSGEFCQEREFSLTLIMHRKILSFHYFSVINIISCYIHWRIKQ